MRTGTRFALLALVCALTFTYFEPVPGLLDRLWVWVQASPLPAAQQVLRGGPPQSVPEQHRRKFRQRLVAVGDLHGDFPNALKVLELAKVIKRDPHDALSFEWSGDTDIFVQTGDIVDRGDDTILLYRMIELLRQQAQDAGQRVVSTHGNHEWMNAIGDWRYVPHSEIETFGSVAARQKIMASGWIGKAWRNNYTVAARVPLHPSTGKINQDYIPGALPAAISALSHSALGICHGGFAPSYPDLSPFPSRINEIGDKLLSRLQDRPQQPLPHPPHPYPGLPSGTTAQEERLYSSDGPLWYRGWAMDPDAQVCSQVDKVMDKLGVRRMIMGHTPNFKKIVSRCGGKILVIDTGISHAYGGVLSALEIVYTLEPVDRGDGEIEWEEHEVVNALYETHKVAVASDKRTLRGDFSAWANVE